ncbi:MAG: DUF2098 domain-containing protein [Methanobrevibacter sp.]|uniref:DUF2098 domain-containing protein n=1 Tax=Methanobrevibacter sp. TaxID=66852 RepID=UPI0025798B57|nr:DUF2098 domain-containing protein [Methanobrevibacter sp.]MBR2665109.1 DUF2098 domain-containing protein [Methanobrevibacter sp.]MBR3197600.1 DUF2098 domain-containing protein [Methanobrevibacter sp.]MBR7050501.1 DUF2098 domain-containing protein [Methanobrevibacter sp.]
MVVDARDLEITLDSHVRYVDTGTIGKVLDLKVENEVGWVKLDKTELWYRANHVELLDEKDIKKSRWGENNDVDIEDLKEKALDFNDLELAADAGNGGG